MVPTLYDLHKGIFNVSPNKASSSNDNLSKSEKESIDKVLSFYGDKPSQWLSDLTHSEEPWIQARKGLTPSQRGSRVITLSSMVEYYESL